MDAAAFTAIALDQPEAVESSHMGSRDFRVRGRIFAGPRHDPGGAAILKLTPEQQQMMCAAEPSIFTPVEGWWGRKGWTCLAVDQSDEATARGALWAAWRNVAPPSLVKLHAGKAP